MRPEIGDVLYRSLRHLVSGEPETLKGWLLLVLALLELRAGEHVMWVDFEQGPAMTLERLRSLGATDGELERFLYLEPREPLGDEAREELAELVAEMRPSLVIFDSYAGLLGVSDADPNVERDIERVSRGVVDVFRSAGAASVLVDHPVKAPAERGRYSSGSGRKLAEVDVHLRLDRGQPFGRGRTGSARLTVLKDRPGALSRPSIGTLWLTSCAETGAVTFELRPPEPTSDQGAGFRPTVLMVKVSRYLDTHSEPVSRSTIAREVRGKRDYVWSAVDHLVAEGYAVETVGPRGARLVRSVRPYRDDPSPVPDPSPAVSGNGSHDPSPVPLPLGRDRDGWTRPHAEVAT